MTSRSDNEALTRVGPGTPMGTLFRRYWIPFFLSAAIEPDGPPRRVRLLGEDLVVFRDSAGVVGLIDAHCAHRGTPLAFGRNEECGLRCIYHGWKYDASGHCVDIPNASATSTMKDHIRLTAYPCQERNGVVWTRMTTDAPVEPLPDVEWNLVPGERCFVSLRVQECNWLQSLEGGIDSSHALLHSRIAAAGNARWYYGAHDTRPRLDVVDTDYGLMIAARRNAEDGWYWRVSQLLMPCTTMVAPSGRNADLSGHVWVPMDDSTTLVLAFSYHPAHALSERTVELFRNGYHGRETGHPSTEAYVRRPGRPYEDYWTRFGPENDFCVDWEAQRSTWFSGIPGIWTQDSACQTGMGPIMDRTREHLGSADAGIIRTRRRLLQAARRLVNEGVDPPGVGKPAAYMVRAVGLVLSEEQDWQQATAEHRRAELGEDFGYAMPA